MRRPVSKLVIPCTALAVLLCPLVASANGFTREYEVVTRKVKFADLKLNEPKAVVTLYERITRAAGQVCEPADPRVPEARVPAALEHVRLCKQEAIAQAVRDVHSSSLTSLYVTTTNRIEFTMAR